MAAGVSWLRVSVCSAPTRKGRSPCPGHTRVSGLLQRESTILRSLGKAGCRTYRCAVLHWRGRPFFKNIREEVQALAKAQTLDTEGERKEVSLSGRTSLCVCPAAVCAPHLPTAAVLRPLPGSAVGTPAPSFAGLHSFDSSTPSGRFLGKDAGEISSKVSRNENVFALFLHGRVEPGLEAAAAPLLSAGGVAPAPRRHCCHPASLASASLPTPAPPLLSGSTLNDTRSTAGRLLPLGLSMQHLMLFGLGKFSLIIALRAFSSPFFRALFWKFCYSDDRF